MPTPDSETVTFGSQLTTGIHLKLPFDLKQLLKMHLESLKMYLCETSEL